MDKIWYRNPSKSEVIGRCGDEKTNDHAEPDKNRKLNIFFNGWWLTSKTVLEWHSYWEASH